MENKLMFHGPYTAVNGISASSGIGETSLRGLEEYGFVING